MLEIMMGGSSKALPKVQLNLVCIEVMSLPEKSMILNLVDIEVLSVAQPSVIFNLLDIEVLTVNTGA